MVAGWMFYVMLVSALLLGAALLVEEATRRLRLPQRGVWVAALAGSITLPLVVRAWPNSGAPPSGTADPGLGEISLAHADPPVWESVPQWSALSGMASSLDPVLIGIWAGATAALLALVAAAAIRLRREMGVWEPSVIGTTPILVSEGTGPAVVGFLGRVIVLPRWACSGDPGVRRLMLTHEEEHLRARDPLLLLAATGVVIFLPWNLPLWWQLRRLRLAVEVDCDERVLRGGSDLRSYATLLMEVGRRRAGLDPALLAFAEPASFLERRIRLMTRRGSGRAWIPAMACATISALLVGAACGLDQPQRSAPLDTEAAISSDPVVTPAPPDPERTPGRDSVPQAVEEDEVVTGDRATAPAGEPSSTTDRPSLSESPAFTPREVEPSLANRSEFARAVERAYPSVLKDAGIGGRVLLWVFVREDGAVGNVRVYESSGYPALDSAAEEVMRSARFTPAENRGERVPVWVALPLTFRTAG